MIRKASLLSLVCLVMLLAAPDARGQWVHIIAPDGDGVGVIAVDGAKVVTGSCYYGGGVCANFDSAAIYSKWQLLESGKPYALELRGTTLLIADENEGLDSIHTGIDSTYAGVTRWVDSGQRWASWKGALRSLRVFSFARYGTNTYAGTELGIYRITDSAMVTSFQWTQPDKGLLQNAITALVGAGSVLYAGCSNGIFVSMDSGLTWNPRDTGLLKYPHNIGSLAVCDNTVIAGATDGGCYYTTDQGEHWWLGLGSYARVTGLTVAGDAIFASDSGESALYPLNNGGSAISVDQGVTWQPKTSGLDRTSTDYNGLGIASNSVYVYLGTQALLSRAAIADFGLSGVSGNSSHGYHLSVYPNPAGRFVTVQLSSPESGFASITIVNQLGEAMANVFSGEVDAGDHSWPWAAPQSVTDGMYECVVRQGEHVQRIPIVLLR